MNGPVELRVAHRVAADEAGPGLAMALRLICLGALAGNACWLLWLLLP